MSGRVMLFVGGPKDGERIAIQDHLIHLDLEVHPPISYGRTRIAFHRKDCEIFACDGMAAEEIIAKLIEGYKTP